MNPLLFYSALRARYRVLLLVLATTVLATLLVSLLIPKTYVATVAMMVDSKDDQSMSNTTQVSPRERTGYMQTQVDIITSEKVAQKVVNELGLAAQPRIRARFDEETNGEGRIEEWISQKLRKQLKVDVSQSSIIRIEFSSSDASSAAQIANAFAKAYMDTALELRVEPSRLTATWFDEQLKTLRASLEDAHARLMNYQKEKGIGSLDERFDVENIALADLASQVVRAQARRAGATPSDGEPAPGGQGVQADLRRAEARLSELSGQLGSNHPTYQRQLAEVHHLRELVNAEGNNAAQLIDRREATLRKALAAQQARVMELKQYRSQLAVLTRDVEIAQRSYETAMQRAVDKRVESQASLTNISILNPAVVPFKPLRPRLGLNILLATVVGLLLGSGIIYLMELFDHRVRSISDLANELHIPVLAELDSWPAIAGQLPGQPRALPSLPYPV